MRKIVVFGVFLAVTSLSLPAQAEMGHWGGMDISIAAGISLGTDGETGGIPITFRVAHQRVMLGIEVRMITPYGIGASALFYVYNGRYFAFHIFDPGVFYSFASMEISAPEISRAIDISAGAGVEIRPAEWMAITLDWRIFLPNPFSVIPDYSGFGEFGFVDAVKGGQVCVEISFVLF
jgi:hypothetical protein